MKKMRVKKWWRNKENRNYEELNDENSDSEQEEGRVMYNFDDYEKVWMLFPFMVQSMLKAKSVPDGYPISEVTKSWWFKKLLEKGIRSQCNKMQIHELNKKHHSNVHVSTDLFNSIPILFVLLQILNRKHHTNDKWMVLLDAVLCVYE